MYCFYMPRKNVKRGLDILEMIRGETRLDLKSISCIGIHLPLPYDVYKYAVIGIVGENMCIGTREKRWL